MIIEKNKVLKLVLFCFFCSITVFAVCDMVHLKNGGRIEGIVAEEDATTITLSLGAGKAIFKKEEIHHIDKYTDKQHSDLKERWMRKYFMHPEFVPGGLNDVASDFQALERSRDKAKKSNNRKGLLLEEINNLEDDLKQLNNSLNQASRNLTAAKPENNLEEYNSLVKKCNSLNAKIQVGRHNIAELKKQVVSLDKKISEYFDSLRLFKRTIMRRYNSFENNLTKQETYFFDGINKKIEEIEGDFTQHVMNYNQYGSNVLVNVLLNGIVEVNLIVDTGASFVVISEETAGRLGANIGEKDTFLSVILADGSKVKAAPLILQSVKVGDIEVKNVKAVVLKNSKPGIKDGLLGMSFLENFMVSIDTKNKKLILEKFAQ